MLAFANEEVFKLVLRDSGQIQVLDSKGFIVPAKPVIRNYIHEKNLNISTDKKQTTYQMGKNLINSFPMIKAAQKIRSPNPLLKK